jgi:hypothetical protein
MYLEAKETAQLYKLLTEKLGGDTTEAMFKYIDNKTERSVEATIKTLATRDDIAGVRKEIGDVRVDLRKEIGDVKADLRKEIGDVKAKISEAGADNLKWMFIFWIGQVAATLGTIFLFLKK